MNVLSEQAMKGEKEIYILFSTSGGTVADGVALFNSIKALPIKITMHNSGMVDSIGNVVFLAGSERFAAPNSSFLFHGVGFDITQPTRFEEKQVKERLTSIQRDMELVAGIIKERTKLTQEDVRTFFLEAQTKTPDEAKGVGIIDEVADVKIKEGAPIISFALQQ
jgi:ATP-dependent protease ClpP protease subunit